MFGQISGRWSPKSVSASSTASGDASTATLHVTVNGAGAGSRSYPATANWDTWVDDTFTANLNAGSNKVRFTATTANGGPNLDKLTVSASSGTTVNFFGNPSWQRP